jgi:hypothetical protein
MQVLGDIVAGARERDGPLFESSERAAPYSYADFAVNVWKTGNLLRHYGVREGARAAVVVGPKAPTDEDRSGWLAGTPDSVVAIFAAMVDGAVVDPDPPGAVDAKVLIAPDAWMDDYALGPGTKALAYGGPPEDPTVAHLEREAWSENPLEPPAEVEPDDPALAAGRTYSHGDLLTASREVVEEYELTADDEFVLRAPLTDPGTIVAGVITPMQVGATVLIGPDPVGTVAIGGDGPEERVVDLDAVL